MSTAEKHPQSPALDRLTALWALSEAGLGGVLHALRTPFTGLLVGGMAILLISLIAQASPRPGRAILRALVVVLIIKALVSPHSPPTAYLAVGFQGLLGATLFGGLGPRLAALLLGPLALLESALQKLLVLTLLFGQPLWTAVDAFMQSVGDTLPFLAGHPWLGSQGLIALYVGGYALAGLLIGWLAGQLPARIRAEQAQLPAVTLPPPAPPARRKRRGQRVLILLLTLGFLLLFQPEGGPPLLWLLLRVILVLALWYLLVAPALLWLLRRYLLKQRGQFEAEVAQALDMLPLLRQYAWQAWRDSAPRRGPARLWLFVIRLLAYTLQPPDAS
ncbi:MAG: hypothetical protein D6722_01740 [Bacteroidetes bacterium]|nr:MAG: hypothetical protein D6722_01740 [Bacteroidota bacterium]